MSCRSRQMGKASFNFPSHQASPCLNHNVKLPRSWAGAQELLSIQMNHLSDMNQRGMRPRWAKGLQYGVAQNWQTCYLYTIFSNNYGAWCHPLDLVPITAWHLMLQEGTPQIARGKLPEALSQDSPTSSVMAHSVLQLLWHLVLPECSSAYTHVQSMCKLSYLQLNLLAWMFLERMGLHGYSIYIILK